MLVCGVLTFIVSGLQFEMQYFTQSGCLRFVEEVREQQREEDERDTSSYAGQQAATKTRR